MKKKHTQFGKTLPQGKHYFLLTRGLGGCFLALLFALCPTASAENRWVTDFTQCDTTYMSIDCEADQYVCGYDGILHCESPDKVNTAKADLESTFNIGSGLAGGLVLNCTAEASSCLPWQCQSDSTCDKQNRNTKCLKEGGFECGECSAGFFNCDTSNPDCEVANGSAGNHATINGCDGSKAKITCDSGYLDCDGNASNGCEIQAGGSCTSNGQVGTYGSTCSGGNPPSCTVFAQQFATVQTATGETVTSKLQIDDSGNINLPAGAKIMIGGVEVGGGSNDCSGNQVKVGTQCVNIPSCEFLKFDGSQFTCATPQTVDPTKLYPGNCGSGQVRIGETCQAVPNCDSLRFDADNGKFLCGKKAEDKGEETQATVDPKALEELVDKKFVSLASSLEKDFTKMLTSVQDEVKKGIKSGTVVAVAPSEPASVEDGTKTKDVNWFGSIKVFFKGLFKK